jgi:serine/threonine-protein phosphatase 6 regulatory ankyrin repeat subunit B
MGAIHYAARSGDLCSLRSLLSVDRSLVNAMDDEEQRPPLSLASGQGHLEVVCFLLDHGAEIDLRGHNGGTALMWACANGHVDVAQALLTRGGDPAVRDHVGLTALIEASRAGDGENLHSIIRALVAHPKVNVDDRDIVGRTALYWACFYGNVGAARLLLLEGCADHTLADHGGQTPLAIASERGQQNCVELVQVRITEH